MVITKDFTWRFDDNNFDSGPGAGSLKFVSFLNNKHSFSVGDQVTVIQDPGATNPGYDGPATITHITSDYEVKINKSFGLSTPAEGGIIIKTNSSGKFNAIHDENDEYKNFEGFFTLKDPSLVISDDGSDTYAFKTKYINGIAKSEYDYFKENNNIDFSLRSKILPYINKWVSTDGTDSRSNPYRLNGELMFGFNNFSPDHNDRSQNSGNFTHEWFYIESKFNYADAPETMLKNNSYFDTKFNLDRALSEEGYFTDYFTYTPSFDISGNGVEEIGETQIRYSPINRNKLGVYESLFKGFKIQFKDYIDANTIDGSGKPEPDISSNRFEDYKFSCILIPKKEVTSRTLSTPVDPPIKYRMIEQNNFKFMLLIIEVSLGSFDQINSYWDSTADTVNKANYNDLSIIPGGATMPYSTINGDYRIKFDDTTGISDLDYTSIYSLKHKKYNNIENNFSTIKLSSNLNLNKQPTTGAFFNGGNLIPNVILNDIRNYPSKVSDEIHFPDTSNFIIAEDLTSGSILFMDQFDISPSVLAVFNESRLISSTNSAVIMSERLNFKLIKDDGTIVSTVPNSTSSVTYRDDYEFRILSGGEVYHQSLFEKLSFATFKEYVNTLDPFIEYESYNYDLDTSTLITNTVNWFVEIPDTSFITKETHLLTKSDSNKPTNAEANADVGFTYLSVDLDNSYELNRYDGGFSPLFKNIFTFNSKYKFNVQSTRITVKSILDSGLTIDFETGTDTILVSSTTYTSLDTLAEALSIAINSNINQYATAIWDSGNSYLDITPTVDSTILVLSNLINVSQSEIVNGNGFKYLDQSNTKFNINIDKFMKLNNFNHIKIANNKILDLESDSKGFKPVYELINEIAIGRADYDLLSSNWDYGFHHQYTDKSTKTPKPGTLRIEEDDSFVSKLVMLRDNIELELIDSDTVKYNIVSVPNLSNINIDDFDLVYTEESSKIKGKLNLGNIITKYLLNDGFATKFNEFLIKDTADSLLLKSSSEYIGNFKSIEEYIKEYIKLNVLKLYEIEKIEFYEKDDRTLVESNSSNSNTNAIKFEFLSDKERFNLGYKENKNLEINNSDRRLILSFNFEKRLDSGLLISPKVKIKFI